MFLNKSDHPPFVGLLEAHWRTILQEMQKIPPSHFVSWHEKHLYTNEWKVYGLFSCRKRLKDHCAQCPETAKLLGQMPNLVTAGFSTLLPGTRIKPHKGYSGSVLRCHLGLVTPEDCALSVAGTVKKWRAGKCLVFDDTSLHEAWNRSAEPRTVLIIDFKKEGRDFSLLDKIKMEALYFLVEGPKKN